MEIQRLSYGSASEQIRDYTDRGLEKHLDTERGAALQAIVDPYSYRGQVHQPKLIILGTNDRYWPVDALNLYWDDLEGERYILYVPNNGHGLRDFPRILGAVAALHHSLNGGEAMPKLDWSFTDSDGDTRLELSSDVTPVQVTAWVATSDSRDFRDATWHSQPATPNGDHGRQFAVDLPKGAKISEAELGVHLAAGASLDLSPEDSRFQSGGVVHHQSAISG
jgi:PhoPQ-activated pathogenicity-related protein